MSEFAHEVGFCQPLGWNRKGNITTCWLPKEAALSGIEMEFEHLVMPGGAQIVVIAPKVEPSVGSYAPKPATACQVRKDAVQVEHLRLPFWPIRATGARSFRIG